MVKLFTLKSQKYHFATILVSSQVQGQPPTPPKCHVDVKRGNLSMDITPYRLSEVTQVSEVTPDDSTLARFLFTVLFVVFQSSDIV